MCFPCFQWRASRHEPLPSLQDHWQKCVLSLKKPIAISVNLLVLNSSEIATLTNIHWVKKKKCWKHREGRVQAKLEFWLPDIVSARNNLHLATSVSHLVQGLEINSPATTIDWEYFRSQQCTHSPEGSKSRCQTSGLYHFSSAALPPRSVISTW